MTDADGAGPARPVLFLPVQFSIFTRMASARLSGFLPSLLGALLLLSTSCSREIPPDLRRADEFLTKARGAFDSGRLREGRALLAEAHALDTRLGRIPQMAEELELLAEIAARAGARDSAFQLYDAAAAQYRTLADRPAGARITLAVAALHRSGGAEDTAYVRLLEALRVARLFKDSAGARSALAGLIPLARTLDRREEEVFLQELLDDARARADRHQLARAHLEAGRSAGNRGDEPRRIEELLRAFTFAQQTPDSLLALRILAELAASYARQNNTREAFETWTAALVRSDVTTGAARLRTEMLTRIGNTYLRMGTPAEAVRFYRAALDGAMAGGDRILEGYLFIQLGHCDAAAGAAEEAVRKYRSAFELFDGLRSRPGAVYALTALGALAERRRQYVDALQFYQRGVSQSEEIYASRPEDDVTMDCERSMPGGPLTADEGAIGLLLQTGRADEAFRLADARVARERAAVLRSLTLTLGDPAADSLLARLTSLRELRTGLDAARTSLIAGERSGTDLLGEMTARSGEADRSIRDTEGLLQELAPLLAPALRPAGLAGSEAQRLVPPGAALCMPVPTSRSLYLLWVTSAGLRVEIAAVGRDQLVRQTGEFRTELARRVQLDDSAEVVRQAADRRVAELSGALHAALVRPVESLLGIPGPLYVVLPPELEGLPYHALGRAAGWSVRRPVAEQAAVHYLPSASALQVDRRPPRSRYALVALGHPGESGWDVEYELRDIRAFDKDVRLLFGREATLENLRAARGDVLHLVLDVRYGVRRPGNARVLFSDGRSPDGVRVAAWGELLTLPVSSLMVLSDLGAHMPGKNPAMAQLLLMTRTPAVVLQGFTAHRRSRKIFGEHLYTALTGGATPEEAFHQAVLQMQRTPAAAGVHQWGAFAFWGK